MKSVRILARIDFPSGTTRLWDGSGGPFLDQAGDLWRPCVLTEAGLDAIENAINGEAVTLPLAISGVDSEARDRAWADYQAGTVVGSKVQILVQKLDEYEQPSGTAKVRFTGTINNITFDDSVAGETVSSTIAIEVVNKFTLRALTSGAVLSDADHKAQSAILNPEANPDRICERIPGLVDKSIRWPKFT